MGKYAEAKTHLERAVQIDPNQQDAKDNLEALQKQMSAR